MSQPLGKVTIDLEVERGADVEARILVPTAWVRSGETLEIRFSGPLVCAACHGGGCDSCGRGGAVRLASDADALLRVTLPRRDPGLGEFALRLPHQGGAALDEARPRGHLVLIIETSDDASRAPSVGVTRIATSSQERVDRDEERRRLMVRSALMATILILTFVGLLRLSGWL